MSRAKTDTAAIRDAILSLCAARGAGKTICPSEAARSLAGDDPAAWGPLMKPVRAVAVAMADAGEIAILRKGRPVDPHDFKGIYRLGLPGGRSAAGTDDDDVERGGNGAGALHRD